MNQHDIAYNPIPLRFLVLLDNLGIDTYPFLKKENNVGTVKIWELTAIELWRRAFKRDQRYARSR